jgi:uncharacterized repeat protein (TIGR03803 family)
VGQVANLSYGAAVPEPSTFALLGIGTVAISGFSWRRRQRLVKNCVPVTLFALALWLALPTAQAAPVSVLHSFTGGTADGDSPHGSLTLSGSMLFGMTRAGGSSSTDAGTVFYMQTNGSGFNLLRSFNVTDGAFPSGDVTVVGGATFYGMTNAGGSYGNGAVFMISSMGVLSVLHNFKGQFDSDGGQPYGSLTLAGSTLYGMTSMSDEWGGGGTVFRIVTTGSGYSVMHDFTGGTADGYIPHGSLTAVGSTLFGTTVYGGATNLGTVFQIGTGGGAIGILHQFAGSEGAHPYGNLTLGPDGFLYGMTRDGGSADMGTVFKINPINPIGQFSVLHTFTGTMGDGASPEGSLIVSGSTLYGMTADGGQGGGEGGFGTIFRMNLDGSDAQILHQFTGGSGDGAHPYGSLTLAPDGSTFYGMTQQGGVANHGTVFSFLVLPGDANGDGTVNGADLNTVLSNYNQSGMDLAHGDFNGDGTVNGADLNTVLSNYNQSAAATAAVPEPTSPILLGIVGAWLLFSIPGRTVARRFR